MNADTQRQYSELLIQNYAPPPISVVSGAGSYVRDDEGREFLDFTSGIAVNALGHSHPTWVQAVSEQAAKLVHCSNLFANPLQGELAERLSRYTPRGRFLFCNSGAEANEALIKFARLHGSAIAGGEGKRFTVITAENAFHGRTFGGMAATPQEKIQGGFRPMLPGFRHARLNDIDSFAEQMDDAVCAILLETVQGEGGILPAKPEFLRDLRKLCQERQVLLLIDEVQCGVGRSGHFFAYQESGIEPDGIGMAKGLAGGFPIGAIWTAESYSHLFKPGSHGTTFGGTPLACSAALAVLDVIEGENLLTQVREQSQVWLQELQKLKESFPEVIKEIRGVGYLIGLGLSVSPLPVVTQLREHGLLTAPAGHNTVRLIPPLIATTEELQRSVEILREVLAEVE